LALVISFGITLSVFPVLGTTTLVCALAAFLFRLNILAIQVANDIAFPLQILLFFPFLKLGETISGRILGPISASKLTAMFELNYLLAIQELSMYLLVACLGWFVSVLLTFILLFYLLRVLINKFAPRLARLKPHYLKN